MSAVEAVRNSMKGLTPESGEDRENLARRMFYFQMEIYSAHAMTTLYSAGDFECLTAKVQRGWLVAADKKLKGEPA